MDAEQLSHLIDRLAGGLGAAAGRSTLGLRGEFLSKHFDRAFELFAEVLNAPAFPEGELERERRHLLQDLAAREDRPAAVAFELFAKTLFAAHPYRLSTIGEKETLSALTREDLVRYHERYLDPSQLVLTVVGDVDTQAVLARAEESFGKTRGKAAPAPQVLVEAPLDGPKEIHRPLNRAQTHLVLGFRAARVTDEWKKPLEVLSTILSGQSGRLFLELRDKRSMAYSVSSSVVEGVDPGWFSVYMATSPEKVKAAVEGIRAELSKLTTTLVTPDELARAREHLIGSHDIGLQRNGARAAVMALDTCYGLGAERYLAYADELSRLTAEDVMAAARRVIDFDRSALAVVGNESSP
jgi:zinc protease